ALFECQIEQRVGLIALSQLFVAVPEFLVKLRLHGWVCIKVFRLLRAAIDKSNYAETVCRTGFLVAALEQVLHKTLNALCAGRLGEGSMACFGQRHGVKDDESDDRQRHECRCADWRSIASDKLADTVVQAV